MKNSKDSLGDRIKENYEKRTKQLLPRRTNTIIRLDGKAFHTFTKGFKKPFDETLMGVMDQTTKYLCESIQGCVIGYCQSDEITLVLQDYDKLTTDAWFDGNVQKITSISASMATAKFNELIPIDTLAMFDSRVFTIPELEEVINCLIWRQQDAVRNSISMVAQSLYSHKELHGKSGNEMQEMIFQKGQNWNDLEGGKKRGRMVVKVVGSKELLEEQGKKLYESGDERVYYRKLTLDEAPKYFIKTSIWDIRDAWDFNKERGTVKSYFNTKFTY